jgi:hypothetical protein
MSEEMREAIIQALDDMGANGLSVCEAAKAQLRVALGDDTTIDLKYTYQQAIETLKELGGVK